MCIRDRYLWPLIMTTDEKYWTVVMGMKIIFQESYEGGNLPRVCAVIILVVASFTYVTAQINGTGTVAARALQIPFEVGVWIGLAGILFCSMLGGMRAVTWTQVAQYIVLIIAYLIPVFWMSNKLGYGLIPHFAQFDAVSRVQELEGLLGVKELLPTAEAQAEAGAEKEQSETKQQEQLESIFEKEDPSDPCNLSNIKIMVLDDYDRNYYLNIGSSFVVQDKRKVSDIEQLKNSIKKPKVRLR